MWASVWVCVHLCGCASVCVCVEGVQQMFFVLNPHNTAQRWFQSVLLLWNVSCVPLDHLHPIQTSVLDFPALCTLFVDTVLQAEATGIQDHLQIPVMITSLWVWNVIWNKHPTKMQGLKKREDVREFYGFYSSLSTRWRKFSGSLEKTVT